MAKSTTDMVIGILMDIITDGGTDMQGHRRIWSMIGKYGISPADAWHIGLKTYMAVQKPAGDGFTVYDCSRDSYVHDNRGKLVSFDSIEDTEDFIKQKEETDARDYYGCGETAKNIVCMLNSMILKQAGGKLAMKGNSGIWNARLQNMNDSVSSRVEDLLLAIAEKIISFNAFEPICTWDYAMDIVDVYCSMQQDTLGNFMKDAIGKHNWLNGIKVKLAGRAEELVIAFVEDFTDNYIPHKQGCRCPLNF